LYDASVAFKLDYIVNITADCPFSDPIYADKIVTAFEKTNADLIRALDLPHGAYSYGIKPAALNKILEIKDDNKTEVWGRYFTDTGLFNVYDIPIEDLLHRQPGLRMTLDYPEDLAFFEAVFKDLYRPGEVFSLDEILQYLEKHPEVADLNKHRAKDYLVRWTAQAEIKLKSRNVVKRAAIIGCGSIGRRHIENLREIGITDIVAFRSRQGHLKDLNPKFGVQEYEDWNAFLDVKPDIAIISNPTSLHLEIASRLIPFVRGIFIEKPLSNSLENVPEFLNLIKANKTISFVGFDLQFHPIVKVIKEVLNKGNLGAPLVLQAQVGHWLPDWHPYEDYRRAYYARKDLGGGVALTLIHEVHLAMDLFGGAKNVVGFFPKSDALPLEVDVIADLMIKHESGFVSQLHLDFLQSVPNRQGIISCEHGWIHYDFINPRVIVKTKEDEKYQVIWEDPGFKGNDVFLNEMKTFLRYVSEGRFRNPVDAWQATRSLAIVMTAFDSAEKERVSEIPDWVKELE